MTDQNSCPLVSVIVPVYNVEDYLERCVRSILGQTYPYLEIILVDDGSTDSSGALCDVLQSQDARILICHTNNRGVSAARNTGLEIASGAYIVYVDADDMIGVNHVLNLLSCAIGADADVAITTLSVIPNGEEVSALPSRTPTDYELLPSIEAARIALSPSNFPFAEHPCGKIFSSSLAPYLVFPEGKYFEDAFIMYRVLLEANRTVYENANDYYYTIDRPFSTMTYHNEKHLDIITARESIMQFAQEHQPQLEAIAAVRYYSCLISVLAGFCLENQNELSNRVYSQVKAERIDALLSPFVATSTKIAFILSFLPKHLYFQVLSFTEKKSHELDQKLSQQNLSELRKAS